MGSIADVVRVLVESGATPEMILRTVEAMENANENKLEKRREADRKRQQARRDKEKDNHVTSRDVTLRHVSHSDSADAPSSSPSPLVPPSLPPAPPSHPPIIPPSSSSTVEAIASKRDKKRAIRLPDDWWVPDEWGDWVVVEFGWKPDRVVSVAEKFRDYWRSVPGTKGVKLDWFATWRNWCRRDNDGEFKK